MCEIPFETWDDIPYSALPHVIAQVQLFINYIQMHVISYTNWFSYNQYIVTVTT